MNFVALDFETATHERNSACELGICVVENSEIVETKTWLIKPPSFPYFNPHNINIHGIYPKDLAQAPTFDEIWYEIEFCAVVLIIMEFSSLKQNICAAYRLPKNLGKI